MTDPDPFAEIRRFYDGEYHVPERTAAQQLSWHMRAVAGRLGDLRGRAVLDVACGTGLWLAELARRGAAPVAGIDLSENAIATCRSRLPQAEFAVGPAEHLPFADQRFAVVTCMGSLEHFVDKPGALAEMRRVTIPGGLVLLLVPNAGFLTRRLGLYRGTEQARVREDVLSLATWQGLFTDAGLTIAGRWRDLHTLSPGWIRQGSLRVQCLRAAQALALPLWPLAWQYQVYFLCRTPIKRSS